MEEQVKCDSDAVAKVEAFIRHLHDLDYVPSVLSKFHREGSDPIQVLKEAVNKYELSKGEPELKKVLAGNCLIAINEAIFTGSLRDGEGLTQKLKAASSRCSELERSNEGLRHELQLERVKHTQLVSVMRALITAEGNKV